MNSRLIQLLKYLLGWPFSIIAFFFILKIILTQVSIFLEKPQQINISLLFLGIFCFLGYYFVRSYIWHRLLKAYSKNISYKQSAFGWAISEARRYIPGNFWALLGRTLAFSEHGIQKKDTGKLVMLEGGIFIAGACLFSLVSYPFIATYLFPQLNLIPRILIFVIVLFFLVVYVYNHKIIKFFPKFSVTENFHLLLLSIISVVFFGLGSYLAIASLIPLPINLTFQLSSFFVLSLLMGFSSLLTPAGFGVREGITISGLSKVVPIAAGAVGALFARIILIFSELIFISVVFVIYKHKNKKILNLEKWVANNKHATVLVLLFAMYVLYFTVVTFLRYDHFYTGRFDLGNMAQTVWNTTQGRIFQFTNPNSTEIVSRLAFHADFLLILIAPFYALFPTPKTLLFIQTVVVAGGSFFVYLLASDKLKNKNLALALAFSYLLSPSVQRANLYDFHPVTLATTFLLAMYYFYSKRNYRLFAVFAVLAAISKEQIWLIVGFFGVLLFVKQNKRIWGSALFLGSMLMFYYLVSVAIPGAAGSGHFALSYYSEFGDGPLSIIKTIIFSPDKILNAILERDKINYLVQIFSHTGYLSILFPFFLIFAGPDLLINLLSSNAQLHQIYYHYTAAITPFIFISTIFALFWVKTMLGGKATPFLIIFVLSTALLSAYRYGPLPGSKDPNTDMFTRQLANKDFIDKQLSTIPETASVAASNNVGSHLPNRQVLYTLPIGIFQADYVVFLLNNSEQSESLKKQKVQVLLLRINPDYYLVSENGEFVMFRKKNI
jgi:uncharacterized membrane protein/uncharacterized membrane protein YbhN (UPF0104 family)